MTVGDMADSDVEDFPGPMDDKFKIKDFSSRNQSVSVPSDGELEAEVADTLKENGSDGIQS